jgi:hypothetical protein
MLGLPAPGGLFMVMLGDVIDRAYEAERCVVAVHPPSMYLYPEGPAVEMQQAELSKEVIPRGETVTPEIQGGLAVVRVDAANPVHLATLAEALAREFHQQNAGE